MSYVRRISGMTVLLDDFLGLGVDLSSVKIPGKVCTFEDSDWLCASVDKNDIGVLCGILGSSETGKDAFVAFSILCFVDWTVVLSVNGVAIENKGLLVKNVSIFVTVVFNGFSCLDVDITSAVVNKGFEGFSVRLFLSFDVIYKVGIVVFLSVFFSFLLSFFFSAKKY